MRRRARSARAIEKRFVLWFNGNGIPRNIGSPRNRRRLRIHPLPESASAFPRRHPHRHRTRQSRRPPPRPRQRPLPSMSALVSGQALPDAEPAAPSIDQVIAERSASDSRFRSLQIGVCQESFGESIQRNLSWAGHDRPLPPEMIPHKLFDRLFGAKEPPGSSRKKSVLDAVQDDAGVSASDLGSRTKPPRRISGLRARCGARHRQPAAGLQAKSSSNRPRVATEGLAAHRQAPERSAGARTGIRTDARRVLHADQVPGPRPDFHGSATPHARHHDYTHADDRRMAPTASASCATSAAGTSKSSPTCSES